MKKFLSVLLAIAMVFSIAAAAYAADDEVTITFMARQDPSGADAESAYLAKKIEEFNALDNGIHVENVWNPVEADYLDRLATDLASGDTPNVFMEYGGSRVLDYLEAGILADLTPYYDADPNWYNSVMESYWEPCKFESYGFEGTYGIPFGAYDIVLVYNQAYLDQCGLEVPQSWEDLMNCCKVLKENGIQPFMVGQGANYRFGHLFSNLAITTYGEDAIKIGNRELGYDSDEAKEIFNMIIEGYQAGYFGENILSFTHSEERAYIGAGDCCFGWDLTSRIYWYEDTQEMNAGNLHVTMFPAVKPEYSGWCQGGASQAYYVCNIGATQEEIDASVELLKFITDSEFIAGLQASTNSTYAIKCTQSGEHAYIYDEINDVMAQTVRTIGELQNYDTEAAGINIFRNALSTIVSDNATTDDVVATIIAGYEDIE